MGPKYAFTLEVKKGYLHARIRGPNDAPTMRRYAQDLINASIREQCPYVLLEENLEGRRLSITQVFEIINDLHPKFRSVIRVVAFVDSSPERSDANQHFAETVAVNRGIHARSFATVKEAEGWMQQEVAEAGGREDSQSPQGGV